MTKGISDIEKTNRYKFFIDKLNNAIKETDMMYLTYKDKPIYINSGNIFNINTLAKTKRNLRKPAMTDKTNVKNMKKILPYM